MITSSLALKFSKFSILFLTKSSYIQRGLSRSNMEAIFSRGIHEKAFVNGEWVGASSGKTFEVLNPATDEIIARVPDMDENDVETAIQAAATAFQSWKNVSAKERSRLLRNWYNLVIAKQKELAELMTLENGKPLKEAIGEMNYSADYLELYAEEAKRIHGEILESPVKSKQMFLTRQPIGVVGMLTPWNFPAAMISRKVAAALAAGCTCVVKPAEDTPLSAIILAALSKEAGIPPGVINIVTCSRDNVPAVGLKLCQSPDVAGISFTGSTAIGKLLYKQSASTVKRISLELGGNAPFIVFESADLDKAVSGAISSKFRNAGQTCVSTNRILVHESLHDEFIAKMVEAIGKLTVGNGMDETNVVGPLINKTQFKKVASMVNDAVSKGAKVIIGGEPHKAGPTFYKPTLLTHVNSSMQCYKEEVFGPVALVKSFKTEDEVVKIANDTKSGLIGYFYSNDMAQIWRVAKELQYGMVGINEGIVSAAEAAFGGIKESGIGREGSRHGLDEYTYIKYLCFGNLA